jgi:hypothetical protein
VCRRTRRNRLRRAVWAAVTVVSVAALVWGLATPAGATASSPVKAPVSAEDAAATSTYLTDVNGFQQMLLANAPKSAEALEDLAGRLGSECPGVLSDAPNTSTLSDFSPSGSTTLSEVLRTERQSSDLRAELASAMTTTYLQPDNTATALLVGSLNTLQWSSPTLTAAVHARAAADQEALGAPLPNVCADMRAWVADDYKTLPAATAEFLAHREAKRARTGSEDTSGAIEALLTSYENTEDAALARRAKTLEREFVTGAAGTLTSVEARVESALGIHSVLSEAREASEQATIIAHVHTAAGGRYVVKANGPAPGLGACKLRVSTEKLTSTPSIGFLGSSGDCLSGRFSGPQPSVECNQGLLTITALAPSSARTARLLLSDGRELTSRLIRAPRLSARLGYYFQIVRGPTPIPTSLTELGADGHVLRVVKLPRVAECTQHPIKYLPGGRPRVLARGRIPDGPSFTIAGERYRYLGHVHSELKAKTVGESGEGRRIVIGSSISFDDARQPPFSVQESTGCDPKFYDIVYGVLKAPGASVLVRIAGVLTPLRMAGIPASLHAGPEVAYGAFTAAPTQLIVRDAHGKRIFSQSLRGSATLTMAECEAE